MSGKVDFVLKSSYKHFHQMKLNKTLIHLQLNPLPKQPISKYYEIWSSWKKKKTLKNSFRYTCHTIPLCLLSTWLLWYIGALIGDLVSNTATTPSFNPTTTKYDLVGWKSKVIIPLSVWTTYSGYDGFFKDHKQKHPFVDCFWKSTEMYKKFEIKIIFNFQLMLNICHTYNNRMTQRINRKILDSIWHQ